MHSDRNRMHWQTPGIYARGNAAVNVTNNHNYTNITHVSQTNWSHVGFRKKHGGHKQANRSADHSPKLQRFCATCGLLDYNVAARMDSPELCVEAAKVVGYNAVGLARNLENMGRGVGECVGGVITVASALVRGAICLFK